MKYVATLLLFFCLPVLAKTRHAPLPDGVLSAKSVYIVNDTGDQGVGDGAYAAFSKWGHFTVAPNKHSADLVASFSSNGRLYEGTTVRDIEMSIYVPNSDDAAYQTSKRVHFHSGSSAGRGCVEDFEKRVEGR